MKHPIRPLDKNDDRSAFDCGVESLNAWFQNMAGQTERRRFARTYVMVNPIDSKTVIGYYTLASISVDTEGLPSKKRLPEKVSAVLLARLANDVNCRGQGLGAFLLTHALHTALQASNLVGAHCVVVDALDEKAAQFYRKFGFEPFQDNPLRLVLFIDTLDGA